MAIELKEIPGFPGYLVGKDGSVWTKKRKGGNDRGAGRTGPPRKLSTFTRGTGYCIVVLDVGGKVVSAQVHRLVLLAFIGEPPQGFHACHYPDMDPSNNRLENLRWDSPSENMKDKYRDRWADPTKTCSACGKTKDKTEFYADKRNIDSVKAECKPCHCRTSMATRDQDKKRVYNREFMRRKRAAKKP